MSHEHPPVYLALDLWQALDLPMREFDSYYERNGWADTWSNLLAEVRRSARFDACTAVTDDGEPCVMQMLGHIGPHIGASDVGSSEPLPVPQKGLWHANNHRP